MVDFSMLIPENIAGMVHRFGVQAKEKLDRRSLGRRVVCPDPDAKKGRKHNFC